MIGNRNVMFSLLALMALAFNAAAQDKFPSMPVHIIVPYAAGASPDTSTRIIIKGMDARIGQPVVVENRPGANSLLGLAYVAKAKPDGHTLVFGATSGLGSAKAMYKSLPYDAGRDFSGIIIFQESYFTLMVRNEEKGTTLEQFFEKMRRNPDRYALGGTSNTMRVLNKMMEGAAKLQHTYVPYNNQSQAVTDLLGGRLGAFFYTANASITMAEAGQAHIMAVAAPQRMKSLPNVPALSEVLPGVTVASWNGYFAPSKTPRPVIDFLYKAFSEAVKQPALVTYLDNAGRALYMSPLEVDAYVKAEEARWINLGRAAGIDPE